MLLFALHNSISTVNTKFCAYRESLYSLKFKHFWVNNQMLINTFLILFIFLSYLYNDGYKTYQANVNHTYKWVFNFNFLYCYRSFVEKSLRTKRKKS